MWKLEDLVVLLCAHDRVREAHAHKLQLMSAAGGAGGEFAPNSSGAGKPRLSRPENRMDVVHLTSAHRADDSRIVGKECLSLVQAGYRVAVVVRDDGTFRRRVDGVEIIPVKGGPGRLSRMAASTLRVGLMGLRARATVYHFHDPELIPVGLVLQLLGKRVIYDVHEDLPRDILIKSWIPRRLRRLVSLTMMAVEWVTGHTFSGIVAATPIIARRFPVKRTVLVQNFAKLSEFPAADERRRTGSHAVCYVGALTVERCAVEMVEAIAQVARSSDRRLILAGNMETDALAARLAETEGWERVDYRGFQSRSGVAQVLSESAAGLALFHPVPSYVESQPVKMFEYMAAGLPVIAADFPRFREIVEGHGCGICVPPRDPAAIAAAIEWIFDHPAEAQAMGRRGRSLVVDTFNWGSQERSLLRLYERLFR